MSHMSHVTTAMAHTTNDNGAWACPVCVPNLHLCIHCEAYEPSDTPPAPPHSRMQQAHIDVLKRNVARAESRENENG